MKYTIKYMLILKYSSSVNKVYHVNCNDQNMISLSFYMYQNDLN